MQALASFLALLNPWAGLFVQAVTMVQSISASAPTPPNGAQKKDAAINAITTAITLAPAVGTEVTNLQTALQTHDPATVAAGLGHSVEMALSICKTFGIFEKAGIVQNSQPLVPQPTANVTGNGVET